MHLACFWIGASQNVILIFIIIITVIQLELILKCHPEYKYWLKVLKPLVYEKHVFEKVNTWFFVSYNKC